MSNKTTSHLFPYQRRAGRCFVTIPYKQLGLRPGDTLEIEIKQDGIELTPIKKDYAPPITDQDVAIMLKAYGRTRRSN